MYSFMLPSIKSKVSVHYGNITEKELTGKIEFISEWTKNMGVDFLDKELKEKLKHVFMEYCE